MSSQETDVILSWSGIQSRKVAEALNVWLREVLPRIKPWISSEHIGKGSAWVRVLLSQLEATRLCIICITPENVNSPWLSFEAGAIAGKSPEARVCPYLIGVDGGQLASGPLEQFQWTVAEKDDTWKLVRDINSHLQDGSYPELMLRSHFEQIWPRLKQNLDDALAEHEDCSEDEVPTAETLPPACNLSEYALKLLLAAVSDPRKVVVVTLAPDELSVYISSRQLSDTQDARSTGRWLKGVWELLQKGLLGIREGGDAGLAWAHILDRIDSLSNEDRFSIGDRDEESHEFELTPEGCSVADFWRAKRGVSFG